MPPIANDKHAESTSCRARRKPRRRRWGTNLKKMSLERPAGRVGMGADWGTRGAWPEGRERTGKVRGSAGTGRVATRSRIRTYRRITSHNSRVDHYRHISQLRTSMRCPAPRKVLHVGDSSKCVALDGVGGRSRTRLRGRTSSVGECHSVRRTGSERGAAGRATGDARASAGCPATDGSQAHSHE